MRKRGLTDRKMINKKFKSTEQAIFIAYYKFMDYPSAKTIAMRAGVSRATFYHHHKAPRFISDDYMQYLLKAYSRKIRKIIIKDNINLKTIFSRTLIFIHSNRDTFKALFNDRHKDIIEKMLTKIKPQILAHWHPAICNDKVFSVYQNEISGIIEIWAKKNFAIKEMNGILDNILFLTNTSPRRLIKLLNQ